MFQMMFATSPQLSGGGGRRWRNFARCSGVGEGDGDAIGAETETGISIKNYYFANHNNC